MRRFISALLSFIIMFLSPVQVLADQVSNNLDATVDATAENVNLITNGANGTVGYWVNPVNGDGKNGCNLTGSTVLSVSVNTSDASVATVSPASITFTSCNTSSSPINVVVTPHAIGTATISLTQTANTTIGTFDLSTATYTVTVGAAPTPTPTPTNTPTPTPTNTPTPTPTSTPTPTPTPSDTTAPVITPHVVGTLGDNNWYTSDVKVTWDVVDNESTIGSQTGCGETNITSDTAGTTLTCSATSVGGTNSQSVTIKRDATAPTITFENRTPANANGWNNGDVTVNWSCIDATSGAVDASISKTVSTDGENQSVTGTCKDNAGNTAQDTQNSINIDTTKPVISGSATPAPNGAGWNNTDVTVSFTCDDTGLVQSGIDSNTVAGDTLSSDGQNQSVTNSGECTDKAGNTADGATVNGINIDKTNPETTISLAGTVGDNNWYTSNVVVTLSPSDNLSGLNSTEYSTDGSTWNVYTEPFTISTEGATTVSYRSTDNAGNIEDTQTQDLKIDKTAPTLNPTVTPNPVLLHGSATAVAGATDAISGIASQSCGAVTTNTVGSHSVNCTATDLAGNTANKDANYNVNYKFDGFLQPINDTAHQIGLATSIFKGGSTIPAKFQLKDANGNVVQATVAPQWIGYIKGSPTTASVDESAYTDAATGGSTYRYDASAQQYIYNWSTKGVTSGFYYKIGVKFDDGNTYFVNLGLR